MTPRRINGWLKSLNIWTFLETHQFQNEKICEQIMSDNMRRNGGFDSQYNMLF